MFQSPIKIKIVPSVSEMLAIVCEEFPFINACHAPIMKRNIPM
jgi:hypothetical protein